MTWGMFFTQLSWDAFLLTCLVRRMPLQESLDTFKYFLSEVDKLKLSYVTLLRRTVALDAVIDGE